MTNNDNNGSFEIDFFELVHLFWQKKLFITIVTLFFSTISVLYAVSLPNVYRSTTLLAPTSTESSGLGALSGQFGGLASLAGVALPSRATNKMDIAMEVAKSRGFIVSFVEKHDLAPVLIATKHWDSAENELFFDEDLYNPESKSWSSKYPKFGTNGPSEHELHKAFLQLMSISLDKETGLVVISFDHFSPEIAKLVVAKLIEDLNEVIRTSDIERARRSIEFLTKEIDKNTVAELRAGLFELIQSQTETIVLASANPEYLFQIIDPPYVPEIKNSPKRAIICVFGAILGTLIAIVFVTFRHFIASKTQS